jgi:hypothetical protein
MAAIKREGKLLPTDTEAGEEEEKKKKKKRFGASD